MNALILSCNTGEGHNSCAKAVMECIESHGGSSRIMDSLCFVSRGVSRFISNWHVRMYRHMPWLFRAGYRFSENHRDAMNSSSFTYRLMSEGVEGLRDFILKNRIDTVICPHIFPAMMVTELKKRYPAMGLKTCFIATDYTCSPGTEAIELDYIFVPDLSLVRGRMNRNIRPEQVVESGIPVRRAFYGGRDKREAKRLLGHDEQGQHILLMCGSMGCGPMKQLAVLLADRLRGRQHMTIVCGTNRRLRAWMEKTFFGRVDVQVLGYAENVPLLMDSADLYLTKPGGISTSEAAVKALPMVLIDAVSGCEGYNKDYFIKTGLADTADSPLALAELCEQILSDRRRLEAMRAAGRKRPRLNGAEVIYSCLSDCGEKESCER